MPLRVGERSHLRRRLRTGAAIVLAASWVCGGVGAETITERASGAAWESAWTNCPARPPVPTDCTYPTLYAATGSGFRPFVTVGLAILRVQPNGTVAVVDAGTGYLQPAPVTVNRIALNRASARGTVQLFGRCGDPQDIRTCLYRGPATVNLTSQARGGVTRWPETRRVETPPRIVYASRLDGSSRPSSARGTVAYNGASWPLGRPTSGRILKFNQTQTLTCPARCPRNGAKAAFSQPQAASLPMRSDAGVDDPAHGAAGVSLLPWPSTASNGAGGTEDR